MELNLLSNIFENNKAINGGAIYLEDSNNNINQISTSGKIENNSFHKNIAENFGGAFYSKYSKLYLIDSSNNTITFNEAGIVGAGIFTPNSINTNLFNIMENIVDNNTVSSFNNNYSTKPSYIVLDNTFENTPVKCITGDYFPLSFTLYDEFDNIMTDITKYYSMTLKVVMIEKDKYSLMDKSYDNYDNNISYKSSNYNLMGNVCSFINGIKLYLKSYHIRITLLILNIYLLLLLIIYIYIIYTQKGQCEMKNFRIYANPNTYIIKIIIENYNDDIIFKFNDIEIEVLTCLTGQIKMKNKNKILYCENPICNDKCPINSTAICEAYYSENINDINKNECKCLSGWGGVYCKNKIFIDFRYSIII